MLKVVAVVVLAGIAAGFLLLAATGGMGEDDATVANPAVPTITNRGEPEFAQPPPPAPSETVAVPAAGTHTAVIIKKAKAKAPPPRPGRDVRVARPGKHCPSDGAFAFTKRLEPLVCRDGRWHRLR